MCRRLKAKLERVAGDLYDRGDTVDALAKELEHLLDALHEGAVIAPPARPARSAQEEHVMRAEAAAGATSVDVVRGVDGTCSVSIGGRRPFGVAPKIANLVTVLAVPGGITHDGLAGWRTHAEVATALNKRTGGALGPRGVPRVVHKLRRAFRDAGENHLLVQTNRRWGVRLAVRR